MLGRSPKGQHLRDKTALSACGALQALFWDYLRSLSRGATAPPDPPEKRLWCLAPEALFGG
eukprot:10977434-Alexandrium_andersonii.AAC.1